LAADKAMTIRSFQELLAFFKEASPTGQQPELATAGAGKR
jgi:hypothetical protein